MKGGLTNLIKWCTFNFELSIFTERKEEMKHWLEVMFLFALFLAGVDAKATVMDEDNFTTATVWVDAWTTRMETLSAKPADWSCDSKQQKAIAVHVDVFARESRKTLEKELSQDDLRYLQINAFFAGNIIGKKQQCFPHQAEGLSALKTDLKNRLK